MKRMLAVSLLLSVFALCFSILVSLAAPLKAESGSLPAGSPSPAPAAPASPDAVSPAGVVSPSAAPSPEALSEDAGVRVRVLTAGSVVEMSMADYLRGVLGAEMPASFSVEALKAQAVAARTMTLYHMLGERSSVHPDADVCDDPNDCQAYDSDASLRSKWGESYDEYTQKINAAVAETDGLCLTYAGAPIQAVFHSSSAGKTADSAEVWGKGLPYLVSVSSPESADTVPNYVSSVTVSLSDFKETIQKLYPQAVFGKNRATWITDIKHSDSGRISTLKLGGVPVTGTGLRTLFGLRSTAAKISIDSKNVTFTTTGYGHGVGMSQYGANSLALEGKTYKDILEWYYKGVSFGDEKTYVKA